MISQQPLSFTAGDLDRGDGIRHDEAALKALLNRLDAKILPLWRNQVFIDNLEDASCSPALRFSTYQPDRAIIEAASEHMFLGFSGDTPIFTSDLSHLEQEEAEQLVGSTGLLGLRQAGTLLKPSDSGLIAYAGSLLHWHRYNRFCGSCGNPTESLQGGRARCCSSEHCSLEQYPRTDPAVIMLVTHQPDDGSPARCLLGHNRRYREGMYSTLAGFVEPGETLEQAVAREVFEETGVTVGKANYLGSQPWPFPSSLMVGFYAEAASTEITVDKEELTDAKWFSREELAALINISADDTTGAIHIPGSDSIAHLLIATWLEQISAG